MLVGVCVGAAGGVWVEVLVDVSVAVAARVGVAASKAVAVLLAVLVAVAVRVEMWVAVGVELGKVCGARAIPRYTSFAGAVIQGVRVPVIVPLNPPLSENVWITALLELLRTYRFTVEPLTVPKTARALGTAMEPFGFHIPVNGGGSVKENFLIVP